MFRYAEAAVEAALSAGARYADARVVVALAETVDVKNDTVESVDHTDSIGVGVRALMGSSWGFYATADLSDAAAGAAGRMAAEIAKASAIVAGLPLELSSVPIVDTSYETPHTENPFDVSLSEKTDMLLTGHFHDGIGEGRGPGLGKPVVLGHEQVVCLVTGEPDSPASGRVGWRFRCHDHRRQ